MRGLLLLAMVAILPAISSGDETQVLGANSPITLPFAANQSHTFEIDVSAGEYLRISAQGEGVTLTCLLQNSGSALAQTSGLGGTGGTATLAAYFASAAKVRLEVRRTDKAGAPEAVRVQIAAQRHAAGNDIAEAAAYHAFASAKTPDELRTVMASGREAGATDLEALATLAAIRALFGAAKYQDGLSLALMQADLTRRIASPRFEAQLLYLAGLCSILLERHAEAVRYFRSAVDLQRTLRQPYELSATLHNMATANQVLGDCHAALQEAEEALAIRHSLGDPAREAISQMVIAKSRVCAGEAQAALEAYRATLLLWQGLHDSANEAVVRNDMGVVYLSLGAFDEARAELTSAGRLRESLGDNAGRAETLVNMGLLGLLTHNYEAALASYEKALAAPAAGEYQRRLGYALEGKAEALFHLNQRLDRQATVPALLHESIDKLREVGDKSGEAYTWRMLGEAESSVADLDRAIDLARAVGDHPSEAVSLTTRARLEYQAHNPAAARASLETALPIIEATRADLSNPQLRVDFLSVRRDAYERLIEVLMSNNDANAEALAISERAHARALLDEIGAGQSSLTEVAGLDAIRSEALDAHTVLVEYFLGEDRSWGWLVSQDRFERFELPSRKVLDSFIRRYRSALTARAVRDSGESPEDRAVRLRKADSEAARAAAQLSHILLGPVAARIGTNRLLVVDDGSLRLIPFAALSPNNEVVLVPSASVLVQSRRVTSPTKWDSNALIFADPVFSSSDPRVRDRRNVAVSVASYPRLPQSRVEADSIAAMLPAARVRERVDFDASVPALRAAAKAGSDARFDVIHIAAHTVLDNAHPEMSGIVFSLVSRDGSPQPGILRLREVYDLRLKTGLITLSACESAIGKEMGGEGMLGISHAFLYAGAQRVVASLWKVEDSVTARIMESFYRGVYRKHLAPAAALHRAQMELRADPRWREPYYWASFVIEGDWR